MRIGIIAWLHESNTFSSQPTTVESFRQNLLLTGEPVRQTLENAHHEVGGFFEGLTRQKAEAVPIFAARALPSGTIVAADFDELLEMLLTAVKNAGPLDGFLVAPHGATVAENHPDADGFWLQKLRHLVGSEIPIVGTIDAHANLSEHMVSACNAIVAYRTNPHLDQRQRGLEAADLIVRTVRGEVHPVMSAVMPPLAISIERQCTSEPHLTPLYDFADEQLRRKGVLSNSIVLGFPYADVAEMGSAVITVTDGDRELATQCSQQLADRMWAMRDELTGPMIGVEEALDQALQKQAPVCLLDMGDNVGGGSSADGTELLAAIHRRRTGPAFMCLFDSDAVEQCAAGGIGARLQLSVGGHSDQLHGAPVEMEVRVVSLHDGRFSESQPRHGGITEFDQGRTAVCETSAGLTIMLTSRRMVPFSLQQLISCGLNPAAFRILVAKGVNAPIAAYRDVCPHMIRVNTIGSTCADMTQLSYQHRRRPLFPIEQNHPWNRPSAADQRLLPRAGEDSL
ncbi:MAG: M81 family metallopeptidase [Planctomycetaceae bacterium]|nr:M81 family metallopeptidase [Planctomycetaceae bacterium]